MLTSGSRKTNDTGANKFSGPFSDDQAMCFGIEISHSLTPANSIACLDPNSILA